MASTPWWSCGALPDLVAPRLVSQRCSASPGSAPMRVCRKCSFGSFAAQSPRPLPLLVRGIEERFVSQSSTWLLVGKAGWLASGTRGRLICHLRQFGPPLCGPPYIVALPRNRRTGHMRGVQDFFKNSEYYGISQPYQFCGSLPKHSCF